MGSDAQLLNTLPDQLQFDALLKARPAAEGERRFLYLEASDQGMDHQGEITLQKALVDSADYYLRHGNLDLHHWTLMGPGQGGTPNPTFEIGRPVAVRVDGKSTFVKAELYRQKKGSPLTPQVVNANMVWDSMTAQDPPMRWYPSVGGAVLAKAIVVHPETGQKVPVITKVRWNNLALDRCPVNKTVGTASTMPVGVFAKSMGGAIVTAGYGTDSASMTGGRALSMQSLDGVIKRPNYYRFRDQLAKAIQTGSCPSVSVHGLSAYAVMSMGVDVTQAAGLVARFLQDLRSLTKKEPA